ncbi:cytochrome P450 [Phanerochaete sordida]|uniref:Cytochrome P450 n=1 Tax=Phanerochaete sordida TaxID=48140 RepID=A0A9P3G2Q2_9APHY|nr:cytochrome P450 [Phanerochaete sordida]
MSSALDAFSGLSTLSKLLTGVGIVLFLNSVWNTWKLRHIPTVGGPALPLLSFLGTFRYLRDPKGLLQEGYDKYKSTPGVFKIAVPDRWLVVVAHAGLIDELQKHPDDCVSFMDAATEFVGTRYALPGTIADDPWHIGPLRQHLTHAIGSFFGDMLEELRVSIEEAMPKGEKEDEWVAVPALDTFFWVFTRVIDRIIVGLPIGRDPKFIKLMVDFTMSIGIARFFIGLVPPILKPAMAKLSARGVRKGIAEAEKMLAPIIADRVRHLDEFGDKWADKPNDLLQINIEAARAEGRPLDEIVVRTIVSIFVGVSTSAASFVHVLYHLAADPDLQATLRAEVEGAIERDGWTKNALVNMYKVDSVLRESQRFNGINSVSVMRTALQDLTLSAAGAPLALPAGTLCVVPESAVHADGANYGADAHEFVPLRFAGLRDAPGGTKHQFVSTSVRYVPFGHGKHACPGRFFAGNEMKAAVAHLVANYDVKLPEGATARPPNEMFGLAIVPNRSAKVLFRRRQAVV